MKTGVRYQRYELPTAKQTQATRKSHHYYNNHQTTDGTSII